MKNAIQRKLFAPRNSLIALMLFKKSGAHGKSVKAQRRKKKVEAQRSLGSTQE